MPAVPAFSLRMNRSITIRARHGLLAAGSHRIEMAFVAPGSGRLGFDFVDEVSDQA